MFLTDSYDGDYEAALSLLFASTSSRFTDRRTIGPAKRPTDEIDFKIRSWICHLQFDMPIFNINWPSVYEKNFNGLIVMAKFNGSWLIVEMTLPLELINWNDHQAANDQQADQGINQ